MLPRRLDKFVREATHVRLEQARQLIAEGQIECPRISTASESLDPAELVFEEDEITYRGQALRPITHHTTYLLHKPKNVTTTLRDPGGKRDLSAWVRRMDRGVFPIGRLDRETTGALLFTTDGDLATAISRPEHQTPKTYWLWLNEYLPPGDPRLDSWCAGVPMLGTTGRALRVEVLKATEDMTELLVILGEGKNRHIRRMCHALDLRLLHLHRKSIGPVELGDLAPGEFRRLTSSEITALWSSVGGRHAVTRRQHAALERQARKLREEGKPHARLEGWLASHPRDPRAPSPDAQ